MGFQSQVGQIGLRTQTASGAYQDPGAAGLGIFMRHKSGGISPNRELIEPDPEIGGDPDTPGLVLGAASYTGDIEAYTRFQYLPTVLQALSGAGSVASTTTGATQGVDLVGTHVITPQDQGILPQLSIEEAVSTLDAYRYFDAVISDFSFEIEPNGYMMNTLSVLSPNQEAGITRTATPSIDTTPLSVGTSMVVTIGGVASAICVRSLSGEYNNNIEDDVFCLGKVGLTDLTPKRREFTLSTTIRPDNVDFWRAANYGSTAATTAQSGAAFETDVNINVKSFQTIGTGVADQFELDINIPVCTITPFAHDPSGDDVIEWDVDFRAVRPNQATPFATFTVKNDLATVL